MAAIFISHSSRDSQLAARMKAWLADQRYEQVFLDFDKHTGFRAGEDWERHLYEEIERCHAVVLILTPNWLESKWCFVEFTQARALGKIIFPIVLSPLGEKRIASEIQGIDLKDWNEESQEFLRRRIREVTDEVARGFPWDGSRPPFPGINSFDREDAAIFFGRDAETREVIERLEARRVQGGKRFLMVLGSSGSGKSSLMKAGVLPQLNRDQTRWLLLPPFRPERSPLATFAKCVANKLGQLDAWPTWYQRFGDSDPTVGLTKLAEILRVGKPLNATILVSIDQFEELFAVAPKDEREHFLALLQRVTNPELKLPYQIIATIRSDIFGDLWNSQQFSLPFDTYALRLMPLDRIVKLIEGPAAVAAVTLENGLAHRIADDVKTSEALPLLAFTLRELYETFAMERRLSILNYEELGDRAIGLSPIENAVLHRANDVVDQLRPSGFELEALKQAFIPHLVKTRDDGVFVRQPAQLSDLPVSARRLIDAFVDARLMSIRTDLVKNDVARSSIVEVAHESLFKAWPLLERWLNEEREFLIGKLQLDRFLADWVAAEKSQKKNALLQGLYLARASHWLQTHGNSLSKDELTFIETSRDYARQRTRLMYGVAILVCTLVGAVVVPRVYAEYAFRTALDCDKYAAEQENNVHVPGVEIDNIIIDIAVPACQSAVALQPGNARLIHNLARSLDKGGLYQDAVNWYRKAADLGWASSQNNLGVSYLEGKGTEINIAKGVSLLRAAADQNNKDAVKNYTDTDFTVLFEDAPINEDLLESALVAKGFLRSPVARRERNDDAQGKLPRILVDALDSFKKSQQLTDHGITLRVLDRLGVADELRPAK
jgi:tetratricopeptide (TPR) repeat protein